MTRTPNARIAVLTLLLCLAAAIGCASHPAVVRDASSPGASAGPAGTAACSMTAASPWIERWFAAWNLTSQRILHLPDAPPPEIVFFDSACVYTTSAVAGGGAAPVDGPLWRGAKQPWRTFAHGGSITLPDASKVPIALMSFAGSAEETGPFFVMAAPSYWAEAKHSQDDFTGVFLHEFAHTRQMPGVRDRIGPIDATWAYPQELDDDAVQKNFGEDAEYVAAYTAERDLLYRSAAAASLAEARTLAAEALAMMRSRHARWFIGDRSVFVVVDDVFLALEGVGQWSAYAWLAHPEGGGLEREAAVTKMLGSRRWFSQDEGLALMLVVDRLSPDWPAYEFSVPSLGATDLLARALAQTGPNDPH